MRKIPFAGIELTSQRVRGLRGTSELPGRPVFMHLLITTVHLYCCFHLTSGTSTAVGPSIVHRNRKRFLVVVVIAPVVQLVTSKPSDVGTSVRISAQSHVQGVFITKIIIIISVTNK